MVLMAGLLMVGVSHGQFEKIERQVRNALAVNKPYRALAKSAGALSRKNAPPIFHVLQADAHIRIGEYTNALKDLARARVLLGETAEIRAQLIGAYAGLGLVDSALRFIEIPLDPSADEEHRSRVGSVYQRMKEWNKAFAVFDAGVQAYPGSARMVRERGSCHAMLGDSASARADLDKAVALAPRDAVNYNSRGYYRYALFGDHARAIQDMDRAIKQDPNYGFAFSNRGWSRYKLGATEKAIKDLHLATRKNRDNPYPHRSLGIIALETGDTTAACTHFSKALQLNFTVLFGMQVEELFRANCGITLPPVPVSTTPVVPEALPPSNAPAAPPPRKGNAP